MSQGCALPAAFWTRFFERYWKHRPVLIKQPFAAPLATGAEIFRALVRASDRFRAGERGLSLVFNFEHALLRANLPDHLPEAADQSTAGYAERMRQKLDGRGFCFVSNEFQVHDAELWLRMRRFLHRFYEFSRFPTDNAEAMIFLGNYDQTTSGLHKDDAHIFMFIIEGRKRIRVWPDECFRDKHEMWNSTDYAGYLAEATTMEGEAGDLIYWPDSYWHVGEGLGELSVTLQIALRMNAQASLTVINEASRMIEDRLGAAARAEGYAFNPHRPQRSARQIPPEMRLATNALREVAADPALEQAIKVSWLNRVTASGFTKVPPPRPGKRLADDELISGSPEFPITWLPAADDEIICSAHGHSFTIAAHPNVLKLIERLNSGAAQRVKSLIEEHAGRVRVGEVEFAAEAEEIRALLELFYSLRAVVTKDY